MKNLSSLCGLFLIALHFFTINVSCQDLETQNLTNEKFLVFNNIKNQNYSDTQKNIKKNTRHFTVEYKAGFFLYQERDWLNTFHTGSYMSIFSFDIHHMSQLHSWLDVGLLYNKGEVKDADYQKTKIKLMPISFGLKFMQNINKYTFFYAKAGPNKFFITTKTDYQYVENKKRMRKWGLTLGIGSLIQMNHFSLDFFMDYLYCKKKYIDDNSNLPIKIYPGGLLFGGGLGYNF